MLYKRENYLFNHSFKCQFHVTPLLWILNNSLYQYKVSKRSNKTIKIQNSLQNHIIQFDISLVSKKKEHAED